MTPNMVSPSLQRIFQPFQDEKPRALADHEPVCMGVKRRAAPGWRQCPELAETDLGIQTVGPGHPAGQNRIAAMGAEHVAGQLYGIKGGCAGGIQGKGRAAKSQCLGQNSGGKGRNLAGQALISGQRG